MREIRSRDITEMVREMFLELSYVGSKDLMMALGDARRREESPLGLLVLDQLLTNYQIAAEERVAICQDTGMAVVFAQVGQDVHITGEAFEESIQQGVREAYTQGYLRKSIVSDPLFARVNTGDNTPCVIHTRIVPGDSLNLTALAKGFGSENMSALKMLVPADGIEGVKRFVLDTVEAAGPNPCPPIIVGIGIGGSFEQSAVLAKECTALPLNQKNADERYAALEDELLARINALGIGPSGTGGRMTALKVHIRQAATHIAGLPVAVNICCHAARHATRML